MQGNIVGSFQGSLLKSFAKPLLRTGIEQRSICTTKKQSAQRTNRGVKVLAYEVEQDELIAQDESEFDLEEGPLPYSVGVGEDEREWLDRFNGDPRKGCDILVQALEREGVDTVFAYPGGASMEIHQALTRSDRIRNILCRHEQGEIFAAEGYAKVTGRVGVCIATSGPGATNLVTGIADAQLDSVPLVAITGQVPRRMIGTDAFQETPIVEVSRPITKHNYLVMDVRDLPRIVKEAFFLARSGRPGPVLIDVPKDVQQQMHTPDWEIPMTITGYMQRLPPPPPTGQLREKSHKKKKRRGRGRSEEE
eukprot:TRINITY_DN6927_c1_g1_i3.p2 TRINITY_DN6927_c1_g1~~TRINITY_DN6927_c1_g1_i3.p2  ORF type:complete len:342 (+),score=54.98 TRINITY_DN6927_c1_g1_i3:106-1026(+)